MWLVSAFVALALLSTFHQGIANDDGGYAAMLAKVSKNKVTVGEMNRVKSLQPLIDYPNIMFWRPQKVGSSTILSLLTSFGFRYNLIFRRKSIGGNYMCRKLATCAYEAYKGKNMSDTILGTNSELFMSLLKDYIKYGVWPLKRHDGTYTNMKKIHRGWKQNIQERLSEYIGPYKISGDHHICFLDLHLVRDHLQCAYTQIDANAEFSRNEANSSIQTGHISHPYVKKPLFSARNTAGIYERTNNSAAPVKEIFIVREPLARLISIYYFWGELYRIRTLTKEGKAERGKVQIGQALETRASGDAFVGTLFTYHGNEKTVPPHDIAHDFVTRVVLSHGMPGPSLTWSTFSNDLGDAIAEVKKDRIMTLVTERLDESLVVARHYMGWTLADVVVVSPRKARSRHPPVSAWPKDVVTRMRTKLSNYGEFDVYDAGNAKLDSRITDLENRGKANVTAEVALLRSIRSRVRGLCLSDSYLRRYTRYLRGHVSPTSDKSFVNGTWNLPLYVGTNKLRDVEDKFLVEGQAFEFNHNQLYAYDVCGPCEAHAILLRIDKRAFGRDIPPLKELNKDEVDALVRKQPLIKDLRRQDKDVQSNPHFAHCPVGL